MLEMRTPKPSPAPQQPCHPVEIRGCVGSSHFTAHCGVVVSLQLMPVQSLRDGTRAGELTLG